MAIDREKLLDFYENVIDILGHGKWWQRLVVVGLPLSILFSIFWFRPLPSEIPTKLAYADECANRLYAEGVASITSELYEFTTLDGKEQVWKRITWKDKLKDRYDDFRRKGWTLQQTTHHRSFHWIGLKTLIQTAYVHSVIKSNNQVVRETRFEMRYTWTKTRHGWYVSGAELNPRVNGIDASPSEPAS